MTLTQHVAITGIAVAALSPVEGAAGLALFAVGSILIDVDHYLLYLERTRCFSVTGMFRYFEALQPIQKEIPYLGVCIFHTVDFFLIIAFLCHFYPVLLPFLAGALFHFALDLFDLRRKGVPFIRAYFLVEHLIRRKSPGYPWY